ncbi:hypothetical protein EDD36DRAFT_418631 [Exophiala viscosa]|uniref:DUF7730 domain-containing protein n=1 Tax=Exophiala viscosa TaxID=2486360 RepID=A0AAN6DUP7_9EURO|nr:hypothetical protein EDD36DRAFT_418631 [Exophiala viscosa]
MTSPSSNPPVTSPFMKLPTEIRLKIYTHLFYSRKEIKIEPAKPASQGAFIFVSDTKEDKETPWLLRPPTASGLSSQILRICRQIHHESLPVLYKSNIFDCAAREGVSLLLIRHLSLDWDQLQDFAWSLAKPEQQLATSGLETIDLASSRAWIRTGSNSLGHKVKVYDRHLCQAALDICQKHAQLRVVQQSDSYWIKHKPSEFKVAGKIITKRKQFHKIRWHFVTEKGARRTHYDFNHVVELQGEMASLTVHATRDPEYTPWPQF